ncbi:ester cyclase [Streptomyces sp. NPDC005811]|uniref:nuclear transport factor 2 family protein n=1 Tax=Streptomyces sp. NPDC005811 TaxID=3154565 RepID=UPI0033CD0722
MTVLDTLYEAWNRHAIEDVLVQFAPEMHYRDQPLDLNFYRPAELGTHMANTFVAMPDLSFVVTSSFDAGNRFAGEAIMRGTFAHDLPGLPATGDAFEVFYGIVGELGVDGKITRIIDYWNAQEFVG